MAGRQVLAQLGRNDLVLSSQPEITFFLEQYKSQGPFATRVIDVAFQNAPQFGTDSTVVLPVNGDLVTAMYARFNLPQLVGVAFFGRPGLLMIERVELYSGSQLIERIWGEFIVLANECEVPSGQQPGLNNLYGGPASGGLTTITPLTTYTVPLRFKALRHGLPVTPDLQVRIILNPVTKFSAENVSIPLDFKLFVEYVFLGDAERDWISRQGKRLYLCESLERARFLASAGTSNIRCVTDFLHPIKELFFTVQNSDAIGFDYTLDNSTTHQLRSLGMTFNDATRLEPEIGTTLYLGSAQFMEYHTRVPTIPFYMYSFSLDPEGDAPSGAVNFGRIKNQYFDLYLNASTRNVSRIITIWARYYQFIEVDGFKSMRVLFDNTSDTGTSAILP